MNSFHVMESFSQSKEGPNGYNGDGLAITDDFAMIVDGATPKGEHLWDGYRGDVYVAWILTQALLYLPPRVNAGEAITYFNNVIMRAYQQEGTSYEEMPARERLQASIILYSNYRQEIWMFGDCKCLIDGQEYSYVQPAEPILANLRSLMVEMERIRMQEKDAWAERKKKEKEAEEVKLVESGYDQDGKPDNPYDTTVYDAAMVDAVVNRSAPAATSSYAGRDVRDAGPEDESEEHRMIKRMDRLSKWSREQILPLLARETILCNANSPFGYDALDGGPVNTDHVIIYRVRPGQQVIMASDGYPQLRPSLLQTENYLRDVLWRDPWCVGENLGTKGIEEGNESYDDRSYIRFVALSDYGSEY